MRQNEYLWSKGLRYLFKIWLVVKYQKEKPAQQGPVTSDVRLTQLCPV